MLGMLLLAIQELEFLFRNVYCISCPDVRCQSGPEIEFWIDPAGEALYKRNDWGLLPFMALSDGAHTMTEEFSYFTLLEKEPSTTTGPATGFGTSLFGISCTRQIRADKLKRRSIDVTRSTVQKAVVVVSPTARGMGELRERVGAVTAAWFAQE